MNRYNVLAKPFEFVQDGGDLKRFHAPGGIAVTEEWIRIKAQLHGWDDPVRIPHLVSGRWGNLEGLENE